jgi:5-formyltetrahydrofolate cyclo-ligase
MSDLIIQQKADLRAAMSRALRELTDEARVSASRQACDRLRQESVWRAARRILCYAPRRDEVDVWPMVGEALRGGKTVVLPRYDCAMRAYVGAEVRDLERETQLGFFGIREPGASQRIFPLNQLDLALVPGVAFDGCGNRLGHGKGYYDRLLAAVAGTKCGVAWDFQVQPQIPAESHDIKLQCILTPTRWLIAGHGWIRNDV